MTTVTTDVSFSFLTSGPRFRVSLPGYFDAVPEMTAPLSNGIGGRAFNFHPTNRVREITGAVYLGTLTDHDGRTVEFHERIEPPTIWLLAWRLSSGALYTHLREEDGPGMADVTVANISVVEAPPGGLPVVLPYPPLEFAASSRAGYHEEASYFSDERGLGWGISFVRPGFTPAGKVMYAPLDEMAGEAVVRVGLGSGVEALVVTGADLAAGQETATMLLDTFTEA
jgi:hypothetical protein